MPPVRGAEPVQPVRRFRCSFQGCTAAFIKRAHLRRHEMTHTQRRDFVCPGCGRPFSRNDSMARHLRRKHPNLCQEQGSSRLGAAPSQLQPSLGLGPSSASTSSMYGFSPVMATSANLFHRPVSRDAVVDTDPYLAATDPSYHGRSSQYAGSPGPRSIETDTGTLAPQWQQFPSSRDRPTFVSDSALQAGRPLHSSSSGTAVGQFYSSTDAGRNAQIQPFFRHPWQLRTYPTRSTETSALSPASSSVRIGGLRYTPGAERDHTAHTGHDNRFQASMRAGDRDFDHIAPQYLQDTGGEPFRQPSPMDLLPDIGGSRPAFFAPSQPPSSYQDWSSSSAAPSFAFPGEHVEIESGLRVAGFAQGGPSGPMSLYDDCQSSSAANSYFKVDSASFPARERTSIFHDTDNVAKFLSEIGLDLPFDDSRTPSTMSHRPEIAKTSEPGGPSSGAEHRIYGIGPAVSTSDPSSGLALNSRTQWVPTQGCSQASGRSALPPSAPTPPPASLFDVTQDVAPQTASNSDVASNRVSQTQTGMLRAESSSSDGQDSHGCLSQPPASESQEEDPSSFCMPHDSFRPPSIARDEEGLKIAAHQTPMSESVCLLPTTFTPVDHMSRSAKDHSRLEPRDRGGRSGCEDLSETLHSCNSAESGPGSAVMVDLNGSKLSLTEDSSMIASAHGPHSVSMADADSITPIPKPTSPDRRRSVPTISPGHTEASLRKIGDRFKAFARHCQAQLHPRADLLPSLEPLLPDILRFDAPIFHAKMLCSQKAHTAEEVLALFALTSVRSEDPQLVEEGKRLACFLYGMVLLSFKLILHMGEKSDAFIKCFLLIGMRAMRQATPDLWHKLKQVRDSVILDVTGASDQELDSSLDSISAEDVHGLKNEQLFEFWLRWYSHESRKRTILLSAILDSQASAYFQPLDPCLAVRPEGPRCQFLFAHVYEPCPDNVFNAWPPESWAAIVATCSSLPSAKAAESAFCRGLPKSLAVILSNQLLKCHVRRPHLEQGSKGVFDVPDSESLRNLCTVMDPNGLAQTARSYDGTDDRSQSTSTSKRSSVYEGGPRARIVPQLHMYALLEAVNGAWMTDSAWYRTPAWGREALPEGLKIDWPDIPESHLTIEALPGWRSGRSLSRHQVAHGLLNWSEMFSTSLIGHNDSNAAPGYGLHLDEDVHYLMIRWQSIFLGLCAPMLSLCFFLNAKHDSQDGVRRERIQLLLQEWICLPCGRRALIHASTILTLFFLARRERKNERLGPAAAHAIYSSIVVITAVTVLLRDNTVLGSTLHATHIAQKTEIVPVPQVWTDMVGAHSSSLAHKTASDFKTNASSDTSGRLDRSSTLYWHGRFEELGLAGIHASPGTNISEFSDWMPHGLGATSTSPSLGPSFLRQRRGSLVEDRRWPFPPRRDTVDGSLSFSLRRGSYDRPVPRQPLSDDFSNAPRTRFERPMTSDSSHLPSAKHELDTTLFPAAETRRWILHGQMQNATLCGLALAPPPGKDIGCDVLQADHLRRSLKPLQDDKPLWCYSESYATLLLAAFDSLTSSAL